MSYNDDPFAGGDSAPSVSFKDTPVGTIVAGTVTEAPKLVQGRDYKTGKPATWDDGNPKMVAVLRLKVDGDTEAERSLWAPKPSSMFSAIAEAQRTAGGRIVVGDRLEVAFIGEEPSTRPGDNPRKLYAARLTKVAGAAGDPFSTPQQPPAQPLAGTGSAMPGTTTAAPAQSPLDPWKANPVPASPFTTPAAPAADPVGAPPF